MGSAPAPGAGHEAPSTAVLLAALLGLFASWFASGAVGLLGHALRRGLTLTALLIAVLLALPRVRVSWRAWVGFAGALLATPYLLGSLLPIPAILATALILLVLSRLREGAERHVLGITAEAVCLLALYRFAITSIPVLWLAADAMGRILGAAAGTLSRRPLWIGATFGGLDLLVPALYLAVRVPFAFPAAGETPRSIPWRRILAAVAAVLLCQMVYLLLLSAAPAFLALDWMAEPVIEKPIAGATPPPPPLVARIRDAVPWNLPLVGALLQAAVALAVLRHVGPGPRRAPAWVLAARARLGPALAALALALAALLPLALHLHRNAPDIRGRKIVLFEKGFLNWLRPRHGHYGRLTIGMYGMVPTYLESLGMKPLVSPDLSAKDLEGADAVVLFFPNEPWEEGQRERLWEFVRNGGNLLVMGEHTTWDKDQDGNLLEEGPGKERNRFNEILAPTAMRVAYDSATFTVGGWLQSYEALAHPTTLGVRDEENDFGAVIGASVLLRPPARPLLIGRWGWADPGDPESKRAMMGNDVYDPGEKLADLVLAAEQPFGKGRIVCFGDTSGVTNGLTVGCYPFTSRLYAYLVGRRPALPGPQFLLACMGLALLAVILLVDGRPATWAGVALVFASALILATRATHAAWTYLPEGRVDPDGKPRVPNNLAYIDTDHMGAFSAESWRPEGLGGLSMAFMRDDFLTLNLPDITPERLERARLLAIVAPYRPYSREERQAVQDFVRNGGVVVAIVGYEERGPSRELLADLGFSIGLRPEQEAAGMEPIPLGHFKAPFFSGGTYMAYVRFHAAWPVICDDPNRLVISFYPDGRELIVMRRVGRGLVVVIGDTFFAVNRNLENEGGQPFEGKRENAIFWRWLIALTRNGMGEGEKWFPPAEECTPVQSAPPAAAPGATEDAEPAPAKTETPAAQEAP
ncbi:MAG: hypothetical protein JXR77_17035, partial [Lentisphaeria bacterium]|nr:hypothetical protein [Lentisphaeria bacterium]